VNYSEALIESQKCPHALAAVIKPTSHPTPLPDAESVVVCKQKIRLGQRDDLCNENCPAKEKR